MAASKKFANCFVTYEERTKTEKNDDGTTTESTYTVAVPIKDMSVVYQNIASAMGHSATYEDMSDATEIYYRIAYGRPAPKEEDSVMGGKAGRISPLRKNWRICTTTFRQGNSVVKL